MKKQTHRRPLFRDPPFTPGLIREIAFAIEFPSCPHKCDQVEPKETLRRRKLYNLLLQVAEREEKNRQREVRILKKK